MNTKKIAFLCTDNVGRSLIAEYCLKDYLAKNKINNIEVLSFGTSADSDISNFSFAHLAELNKIGINTHAYQRTQLNSNNVNKLDLIIGFDNTHKEFVKKNFNLDIPLFNELYKNEDSEVKVSNFGVNKDERMIAVTHYINDAIPVVYNSINNILTLD